MVCIYCSGRLETINSRAQTQHNQVWRRRHCKACDAIFTTDERVDYAKSFVVRGKDGAFSPLLRDKLFVSILKSCQHRRTATQDAAALTGTVLAQTLSKTQNAHLTSAAIAKATHAVLTRFDDAAAVHYHAYHADSLSAAT